MKLFPLLTLSLLIGCATPSFNEEQIIEACRDRAANDEHDPKFVFQSCMEQHNNMIGDYFYGRSPEKRSSSLFENEIKACNTDTECERAWRRSYESFNQ